MKSDLKKVFQNKTVRTVLLLLLALVLLFVVWKVFFTGSTPSSGGRTETELRLQAILLQIEGVERAEVLVTEEEGTPQSAVIVLSGDASLFTDARAIDATALALNLQKSKIKVYRGK